MTSWTKFFDAVYLLAGEEPKPSILSDVFEVLTIESNDSGTDGTRGEGNQNISKTASSTVLERIGLTDSTVFLDGLFVRSLFRDEIKGRFDSFGWPTCLTDQRGRISCLNHGPLGKRKQQYTLNSWSSPVRATGHIPLWDDLKFVLIFELRL